MESFDLRSIAESTARRLTMMSSPTVLCPFSGSEDQAEFVIRQDGRLHPECQSL